MENCSPKVPDRDNAGVSVEVNIQGEAGTEETNKVPSCFSIHILRATKNLFTRTRHYLGKSSLTWWGYVSILKLTSPLSWMYLLSDLLSSKWSPDRLWQPPTLRRSVSTSEKRRFNISYQSCLLLFMSNCTGFGTASVLLMFNDINHFVMKSLCFILIQLPFQFIRQTQFKLITLAGRQVLKRFIYFLSFQW